MKRCLTLSLILISTSACSLLQSKKETVARTEVRDVPYDTREADGGLRHRILVLPFLDEKSNRPSRVPEEARRAVIKELARTGQFVLVSSEDFPQDPKKLINADGDYDLGEIARIAAGIGVAAVLEGKILQVKAQRMGDQVGVIRQMKAKVDARVRLRLFAGKNGREVLNEVRSATIEAGSTRVGENAPSDRYLEDDPELVQQAIRKAAMGSVPMIVKAVEKLNWEGRIAMVSGERVFINAGRLSGIQIGDILKITDEGDEVFDPETGRFIGKAPGRMKGTVEIISYFGKDGAISVIHSGSGFKENDRVELY